MPDIPPMGSLHDFYVSPHGTDIGVFPGGLIEWITTDTPIRLQRGDSKWGARHIAIKHGHWLKKEKLEVSEMVWRKLSQPGSVYVSEDDGKLKISLRIHPSALMILRYIKTPTDRFFTVVSVYAHPNALDGTHVGVYRPPSNVSQIPPVFTLPLPPPLPQVTYKKRRTLGSYSEQVGKMLNPVIVDDPSDETAQD
jgi:hypothetical protein